MLMEKIKYEAPEGVVFKILTEEHMCLTVSGGNEPFYVDDYDGEWGD